MESIRLLMVFTVFFLFSTISAYYFWRYIWFFRNPKRQIPKAEGILSPADGSVVYVRSVPPSTPVISIKKNKPVTLEDIVKSEIADEKLLVGVFMSPFNVHYNRCPISGKVEFVRHYPAVTRNYHMGSMHWRSILRRVPIYQNSPHILHNERMVTKIAGQYKARSISCYVVQIAGGSVRGIESRVGKDARVFRGQIFGMIKIGSQVDVVISKTAGMKVCVKSGDRVKAGETLLIV